MGDDYYFASSAGAAAKEIHCNGLQFLRVNTPVAHAGFPKPFLTSVELHIHGDIVLDLKIIPTEEDAPFLEAMVWMDWEHQ